jgi:hypothetical protein
MEVLGGVGVRFGSSLKNFENALLKHPGLGFSRNL